MSARTLTELVTFVATQLAANGDESPVLEGPEHLPSNDTSAPRYVFLAQGGSASKETARRSAKDEPDAVCVFRESIDVHIWGVDMANAASTSAKSYHRDAAVMMLGNALTALTDALGHEGEDLQVVSWSFVGQNDARWTDHGAVIVLRFTMPVPVPYGYRVVTAGVPVGGIGHDTAIIAETHTEGEMQTSHDPTTPVTYYEVEP